MHTHFALLIASLFVVDIGKHRALEHTEEKMVVKERDLDDDIIYLIIIIRGMHVYFILTELISLLLEKGGYKVIGQFINFT